MFLDLSVLFTITWKLIEDFRPSVLSFLSVSSIPVHCEHYHYIIKRIWYGIPYSFNNVVDIRNVQQIQIEIEIKYVNVKYN